MHDYLLYVLVCHSSMLQHVTASVNVNVNDTANVSARANVTGLGNVNYVLCCSVLLFKRTCM